MSEFELSYCAGRKGEYWGHHSRFCVSCLQKEINKLEAEIRELKTQNLELLSASDAWEGDPNE